MFCMLGALVVATCTDYWFPRLNRISDTDTDELYYPYIIYIFFLSQYSIMHQSETLMEKLFAH